MKKIITIIVPIVIIIFLGYYAKQLLDTKGKSDTELIDFAIEDTSSVDKIILTDAFSNAIELIRKDQQWTDSQGGCVIQEGVHFMLDAFKNIEFKGYLPDNSHAQITKLIATQHTKVEIYQHGDWTKTWYIGPAAQDHYGQVMLLDSYEYGKSTKPVMMKIKGLNGIIEPRFFADKRKWQCTQIFALPIERIAKVDVRFYDDPELSFTVTKKESTMNVYHFGKKLTHVDTAMIFRYLQNYKKIHYDLANYTLGDKQIDSMKRSMPFAKLTVTETNGVTTKLRMFRIKSEDYQTNEFGDVVNMDMNHFWCELPNGELVKCQYFVFNPILMGHIYFPLNLEARSKNK